MSHKYLLQTPYKPLSVSEDTINTDIEQEKRTATSGVWQSQLQHINFNHINKLRHTFHTTTKSIWQAHTGPELRGSGNPVSSANWGGQRRNLMQKIKNAWTKKASARGWKLHDKPGFDNIADLSQVTERPIGPLGKSLWWEGQAQLDQSTHSNTEQGWWGYSSICCHCSVLPGHRNHSNLPEKRA